MDKLVLGIEDTLALERSTGKDGGSSANCVRTVTSSKQSHNAKERLRRMNLSASYTALRYLLPNSNRSKGLLILSQKRWSAPKILEKALRYIPDLLAELERLTLDKESRRALSKEKLHTNTSITITEVVTNCEFALQICAKRDMSDLLSSLIRKVEDNGMSIKSVSSVQISDDRICCHLHIEMNNANRHGIDCIAILKDDLASLLK